MNSYWDLISLAVARIATSFEVVGQDPLEADVRPCRGDTGRQLRCVEEHAIRAPYAATAPDDFVEILLILGPELLSNHFRYSRHFYLLKSPQVPPFVKDRRAA